MKTTYPTLRALTREIIEQERDDIHEASDIYPDWRNDLIKAWRADVDVADCYDAYMNPVDMRAETLLEQISATSPYAVVGEDWPELQRLMSEYWWLQISPIVDRLIPSIHEDFSSERQDRNEWRDEQKSDWNRERYALAKEFAA